MNKLNMNRRYTDEKDKGRISEEIFLDCYLNRLQTDSQIVQLI